MEQEINNKYMVYVPCLTYNHSKYIADTLNGFCLQETSFPYICAILDDASTDGAQKVILDYLDHNFNLNDSSVVRREETTDYLLTFAQHKTNYNCFFVVVFLKYNHYQLKKTKNQYVREWYGNSKYIACCEGDDYWIDPLKLQKQVDYMESHPNCSLCFSNVYRKDCDSGKFVRPFNQTCNNEVINVIDNHKELFFAIINRRCRIPSLSVLYRRSNIEVFNKEVFPNFMMGDTPLWIRLSQTGLFKYFDEVFGVYCIHKGSVTHSAKTRLGFTLNAKTMCVYYCNKFNYPVPQKIKNEYNRAYLRLILNQGFPEQYSDYNVFPNAVFSWAFDKEGHLKYNYKKQIILLKVLSNIENFIYENKIRCSLWLNTIIKR